MILNEIDRFIETQSNAEALFTEVSARRIWTIYQTMRKEKRRKEVVRLDNLLRQNRIEVIHFKGTALEEMLYGDQTGLGWCNRRRYRDSMDLSCSSKRLELREFIIHLEKD